jgi:ATP-dependent phosphoenolpyruvate carboxykinase
MTKSPPVKPPLPDEEPQPASFDLSQYGITVKDIRRNLSPAALYSAAIREDEKCDIADTGALIAFSGEKTGRSPKDKRVVEHPESKDDVWWGAVNVPIDDATFDINRERAIDYLNSEVSFGCSSQTSDLLTQGLFVVKEICWEGTLSSFSAQGSFP